MAVSTISKGEIILVRNYSTANIASNGNSVFTGSNNKLPETYDGKTLYAMAASCDHDFITLGINLESRNVSAHNWHVAAQETTVIAVGYYR